MIKCNQLLLTISLVNFSLLFFSIFIFYYLILSLHLIYLITLATRYFAIGDYSVLIPYYLCHLLVLWTEKGCCNRAKALCFKMYSFHQQTDTQNSYTYNRKNADNQPQ